MELDGFSYDAFAEECPHRAAERVEWLGRHPVYNEKEWARLGPKSHKFNEKDSMWAEFRSKFSPESCDDLVSTYKAGDDRKWSHLRPRVSAQPYEHLAEVLRKSGHEGEAREVLIEKNWRMADEVKFNWRRAGGEWWWYKIWGPLLGFGYETWRAFWASVALIMVGWLIFRRSKGKGFIIPTDPNAYVAGTAKLVPAYPPFNAFIYSLETFVPLVKLGQADHWGPLGAKRWLHRYSWFHISAGWVLTTVWVAGLTGVLKT